MLDRAKKTIVWVVSVLSVALHICCTVCTKADTEVKGEHAPVIWDIALTLAGNGICVSSIALLFPLFGKQATWIIMGLFLFGSIAIGLAINAIGPLLG